MMLIQTLKDLRRALRPLGYGVKTKAYSTFVAGQYVLFETKQALPDMFFSEESRTPWIPLMTFLQDHQEEIRVVGETEGITGLRKA